MQGGEPQKNRKKTAKKPQKSRKKQHPMQTGEISIKQAYKTVKKEKNRQKKKEPLYLRLKGFYSGLFYSNIISCLKG